MPKRVFESLRAIRQRLSPFDLGRAVVARAGTWLEDEDESLEQYLVGYWVQPHGAAEADRFEVAAFSPAHAVCLVKTYMYPFVPVPEPFEITEVEPPRIYSEVDIRHPDLPRQSGSPVMPWAHPVGDEVEVLLDLLVEQGFCFIDIPGMTSWSDGLFDDWGFRGSEPTTGCHKIAFILSSPAEDLSDKMPEYADRMDTPLFLDHYEVEEGWATVEPRLVLLDGPLPEKYVRHLCPYEYGG